MAPWYTRANPMRRDLSRCLSLLDPPLRWRWRLLVPLGVVAAAAEAVGAAAIITACPKCRIHLTCARKNTDHHVEILDLVSYLAAHIE